MKKRIFIIVSCFYLTGCYTSVQFDEPGYSPVVLRVTAVEKKIDSSLFVLLTEFEASNARFHSYTKSFDVFKRQRIYKMLTPENLVYLVLQVSYDQDRIIDAVRNVNGRTLQNVSLYATELPDIIVCAVPATAIRQIAQLGGVMCVGPLFIPTPKPVPMRLQWQINRTDSAG
jgi:hypothetical protein